MIYGLVLAGGPDGEIAAGSLAVFLDLGCGFVNYYCYGANVTGNVIANPFNLQAKRIPMLQNLFSTWGAHNGLMSIGWSLPSCTDTSFCTQTGSLCGTMSREEP